MLGIAVLNLIVVALNYSFPDKIVGIGEWIFIEIAIWIIAIGLAVDLIAEKEEGRSVLRYTVKYPAIWIGLGVAAFLIHKFFLA